MKSDQSENMLRSSSPNFWLGAADTHYRAMPGTYPWSFVAMAFYCLARAAVLILLAISAKMKD